MDEALDDGVDSSGDALSRSSKPEFVGSASDEVFSRCHTECDGEAQEDSFDLMRGIANPICGPDANEPAPLSAQRNAIKEGGLSKERISLLDAIGFIWRKDSSSPTEIGFVGSLHDQKWQQMFDELVKYKQQYGNCDIPMNWPTSPRLAGWVSSQRTAKKTGKLPAYRFQLLDELGFIWQKNRGRSSLESNGDEKE